MNTTFTSSRRLAALLLVIGIGLAGCAGVSTTPPPAIQQQIEAARTPADHEALAAYYVKEAGSARAKVAEHRAMGKAYTASPPEDVAAAGLPTAMRPRRAMRRSRRDTTPWQPNIGRWQGKQSPEFA